MESTEVSLPQIVSLPIAQIAVSRHQLRKKFDEDGIKSLAASIDKEGLIQPIAVRAVDGGYELIAGERRLRAVKSLGRDKIDAIVISVPSEAAAAAKGMVENIQRIDLNPIEEAKGFDELQHLDPKYWTQEQIALVSGKTQGHISQGLSLLELSDPIQEEIRNLTYSRSKGVELARLPDKEKQLKLFEKSKGLTREATRKLVDHALGPKKKSAKKRKPADPLADLWPTDLCEAHYDENGWTLKISKASAPSGDRDQTRQALAEILTRIGKSLGESSANAVEHLSVGKT